MNPNHEHACGCEHTHEEENQYNKYEDALSKYQTNLKDDEIAEKTARLIEKHLEENNTKEVKKFLFNCIDLTTLKCTDSDTSVMKFTEKVNEFVDRYPDLKNVAAICVYPNMAEIVNDTLEADDVKIACVSGGFPSSQTFIEVKVAETAMAIHSGADEIDIVISVGKFLSGDYEGMCDEIEESERSMRRQALKSDSGNRCIGKCFEHQESFYPFYVFRSLTLSRLLPEKKVRLPHRKPAYVMCQAIKEYFLETGRKVGFKPAGGINSVHDALVYYTIVKRAVREKNG